MHGAAYAGAGTVAATGRQRGAKVCDRWSFGDSGEPSYCIRPETVQRPIQIHLNLGHAHVLCQEIVLDRYVRLAAYRCLFKHLFCKRLVSATVAI